MASICVFCCTRVKSDNYDGNGSSSEEIIYRFFKVTQSHFRINVTNIIGPDDGCHHLAKVCLKCEQSLQSICQLHRELECIRLKLEWEFGDLIRKMKVVGRTPSKVKWLRENQPVNEFLKMTEFREHLILSGNQSLSRSTPIVNLHRTERHSGEFPNEPIGSIKDVTFPDNVDTDNDDDVDQGGLTDKCSPAQNELPIALPPPPVIQHADKTDHKNEANSSIPPSKKYIDCPHCPIKFSHRSSYRRHQRKQHPPFIPSKGKPSSTTSYSMPSILPVFSEALHDSQPDQDSTNHEDKLPRKKCLKCPYCPKKFASRHSFSTHLRRNRHHQIPHTRHKKSPTKLVTKKSKLPVRATCSICQQSVRKHDLKAHFNLNHSLEGIDLESVYRCDHANCPAYFRTLLQLQRHKREVHDNNDNISKTTCPICSRICSEFGNLKFHMRTQHDDESPILPLACDVVPHCPKRFPDEAILKWHRKYYYHAKTERPVEIFKCPECNRELHGSPAFKKHQKTHQRPEAPYVCELCGAAFKKKSILKSHELFHKGPDNWAFQCEACGKKCATKHRLRDHMNVHSDVKLYSCEACGRGFKCRQKLREHVNKFHATEGFQDIPRKRAKAKFISRRTTSKVKVDIN